MSANLYQLSGNGAEECSALPNVEMYNSCQGRPCELHLPSSDNVNNENSVVAIKSPVSVNGRLPLGNYQYTAIDKRAVMPSTASKKVMVAPQPHYRSHNSDMCENVFRANGDMQITHRRRIGNTAATTPTSAYSVQFENRAYPREVSVAVIPMPDDDRVAHVRSGSDVRVSALEERVRDIEAVINNNGQLPNSPSSSTSYIPPASQKGPPLVLSPVSPAATHQLIAQEIADRDNEIERLQSQLRQCYSRMELRKIRFEEEIGKFRKESQEAKSQLEKVKSRLGELEVECSKYRERATYVEAARNTAISDSLEKISTQEKELSRLRGEVEQLGGLSAELETVKSELKKSELSKVELQGVIEAKNKIIHDLEDFVSTLKMGKSCKFSSSFDEDLSSLNKPKLSKRFNGVKELKTPLSSPDMQDSTSSQYSLRLKKSQSFQQLPASMDKAWLPSSFSTLVLKQSSLAKECRLLAKCLKDVGSKTIDGELPSVLHLLGCQIVEVGAESTSESETDSLSTDQSPMTLPFAEYHIKKAAEYMQLIESDLNSLREKFVEYYEGKIIDDLQKNDMCKFQ
uniref:TACC_C domain-containing protein n=1 Tax=Syphacia muris TaxID=451379 RepID=A0A0N5AQ39_9BILA